MNEIRSKETASFYIWGNQCVSWVLSDSEGLSVKQECMPAGTSEQLHYHKRATQFFYILKGVAIFCIDNRRIEAKAGQGITIECNQQHSIANETDEVLEFLVISQPSTQSDRFDF